MLVVIVIVAVGAFHAHSDAQFSRWVGWATVAALPVAAIASLPYLGDKISGSTRQRMAGAMAPAI